MKDGGMVALESGFSKATVEGLQLRGHQLRGMPGVFGGYQAIMYDAQNDVYRAASESRKDGHAGGY